MPTYRVSAVVSGTISVGVFDADTEEQALEMAYKTGDWGGCLCCQCIRRIPSGLIVGLDDESVEVAEVKSRSGGDNGRCDRG